MKKTPEVEVARQSVLAIIVCNGPKRREEFAPYLDGRMLTAGFDLAKQRGEILIKNDDLYDTTQEVRDRYHRGKVMVGHLLKKIGA
jgi:hypothetical protein